MKSSLIPCIYMAAIATAEAAGLGMVMAGRLALVLPRWAHFHLWKDAAPRRPGARRWTRAAAQLERLGAVRSDRYLHTRDGARSVQVRTGTRCSQPIARKGTHKIKQIARVASEVSVTGVYEPNACNTPLVFDETLYKYTTVPLRSQQNTDTELYRH